MWKEFKEFALRGNVMDLAVAVIIGAAFGKIVTSLVDNILSPLIGLAMGGIDFSGLQTQIGGAVIQWGLFIQAVIDFVIIAFVIFMLVRAITNLKKEPVADPVVKDCPYCFTSIPIQAKRCPNCTSQL